MMFDVRSMVAPLARVVLRQPTVSGAFRAAGWTTPDPLLLQRQHEALCTVLADLGTEVIVLEPLPTCVDACYVRDPVVLTTAGVTVLQAAKRERRGEGDALADALSRTGLPTADRFPDNAFCDGGDLVWIDTHTLLAGHSYRTNHNGIKHLRELLRSEATDLVTFDLPHYLGPGRVLHLMSVLSPVTDDLAVVYEPLAPIALLELLHERGIKILAAAQDEYGTQGANVLAVRPGVVVMCDRNPATRRVLEAAGCEVHVYPGSEISVKGEGGPTCLTLPILRR